MNSDRGYNALTELGFLPSGIMIVKLGNSMREEEIAIRRLSDMFPEEFIFTTSATVEKREIDCILICQRGIIVIELKNYSGLVTAGLYGSWQTGAKVDKKGRNVNPFEQAGLAAKKLKSYFVERFDGEWPLFVDSLVVLINERAELDRSELEADQAKHVCLIKDAEGYIERLLRSADQISPNDCFEIVECLKKPRTRGRKLERISAIAPTNSPKAGPVDDDFDVDAPKIPVDSTFKQTMREKFIKMVSNLEGDYEIGN